MLQQRRALQVARGDLVRRHVELPQEIGARDVEGHGKEINAKRLEAVPWTRHCIECQEKAEQGLLETTH